MGHVEDPRGQVVARTTHSSIRARAAAVLVLPTLLICASTCASLLRPSSVAAATSHALTLYSVATGAQYINNNDDEARGDVNNPYGTQALHGAALAHVENGNGPFAGDQAIFTFKLYGGSNLKASAGSAMLICQYNFNKNAFCDASYYLRGGALIGGGPLNFNAKRFALAITGGTKTYSRAAGEVDVSPSANHAQRLSFIMSSSADQSGDQAMTLYSAATAEQFVNNEDDRARGKGNNPFGNYFNSTSQPTQESVYGPFPGDQGLFGSVLYGGKDANKSSGSAVFTCQYGFGRNASCDASFQLNGGTLIGIGAFNFSAQNYVIAVTGGTGKYRGAHGTVHVSPSTRETPVGELENRLVFVFD